MVAVGCFFWGRLIVGLVVDEPRSFKMFERLKVEADVDAGRSRKVTREARGKRVLMPPSRVKICCQMAQSIEQPLQFDENFKSKEILLLCQSLKITE
jgi:hypothetical protein